MTLHREIATADEAGIANTSTPKGLASISHPRCAAAIWNRAPLDSFQNWIAALDPGDLPRARLILQPSYIRDAMTDICESSGLPDCAERTMLIDDVAALSTIFAEIMVAPYLRLRLDVITTNACRKFHVDALTARLICTYRGSGTQYGIARDGQDPVEIFDVPPSAPMIMRGTLWPNAPQSDLVHRSPPIEGTGETRLVLVLDPIVDLSAEQDAQYLH